MTAKSYRGVLERIEEIAPQTRSLFLRLPAGRGVAFQAGQFLSFSLPVGDKPLTRAYSIASPPEEPELLEICLNLVPGGAGSAYLFALEPGAEIDFTGPWGTFLVGSPPPASLVFVGQGTGVAPLRPMIRAALARPEAGELTLIHAAADAQNLLFRDDFVRWQRGDGRFRYAPLLEGDAAPGHLALMAAVERDYVEAGIDGARHFFICGIGDVVTRLRDLLRGAGYERRSVHYEKW